MAPAHKQRLATGVVMALGAPTVVIPVGLAILNALSLIEGFGDQRHHSTSSSEGAGLLVQGIGLALKGVSAADQDARCLVGAGIGQIEMGRQGLALASLDQDSFNAVAVSLAGPLARDPGRRAILRGTRCTCQAHEAPSLCLPFLQVSFRGES